MSPSEAVASRRTPVPSTDAATLRFHAQVDPGALLDNLSAVTFDGRYLWAAADECNPTGDADELHNTIERLTWDADTGTFNDHRRFVVDDLLDLPAGPDQEIDVEGLAVGGGYLWVVGSHGRKMRKPKRDDRGEPSDPKNMTRVRFDEIRTEPNRYLIARIPTEDGELRADDWGRTAAAVRFTRRGNLLTKALARDPHVGHYVRAGVPGKANGFDVEGLEYVDGRLFIGLRGPVLADFAFLIEVEPTGGDGKRRLGLGRIGPDGERYRKHFVRLHGRGVRDLCRDGNDLLVLAGPTMGVDGPAAVYRLHDVHELSPDAIHLPEFVRAIPFRGEGRDIPRGTDHAEGLTLVPNGDGRKMLVVYDSPDDDRKAAEGDAVSVTADLFDL